jgi:PAS domain S-box-containing protein
MSIIDPPSKQPSDELDGADPANRPSPPEQPSPSGKLRQRTLRFWLTCLVLTCVLPICFIVSFLVYYSYQQQQRALESSMTETARALSMVIDRQLEVMQASATALSTSPSLATGDFATFHHQMQSVLRDYPGADIVLADATGQQLANSFVPFGKPLPKRNVPEAVQRVFETGKPVITNLFKGALTGHFTVGVDVPVFLGERVAYDLALTIPAERLQAVFSQQRIPTEWPSAIIDANYTVVARNRLSEKFVGTKIFPDFIKRLGETSEGFGEFRAKEGITVVGTFSRSKKTGWTIFVGIPKAVFIAGVWRSQKWAVFGIILLSITAVTLALFLTQCIAASITERKRAEEALRSSQAKLQSIIGSAMDAVISVDEQQRIVVFNRAAETVFQCVASEVFGSTLDRFIPKSLGDVHREHIRRFGNLGVTARSMISPGILTAVRSNGEEFPIEATISQVQSDGEKLYTVILRDVTERKKAEDALRDSEQQFRELAEGIPQLAWTANPDGWIYWYNQRWYQYTGTSPQQTEGWGWQSVHDPNELPKVMERWKGSIATGESFDMVFPLRGADGVFRPFLTRVMPLRDTQGQVVR